MKKTYRCRRYPAVVAAAALVFTATAVRLTAAESPWILRSGSLEVGERSLLMAVKVKKSAYTPEEARRKAEDQLRRLRERLVLAVAADRAGLAGAPAIVAALEEFRLTHIVDLFMEEKIQRAALEATKGVGDGDKLIQGKAYRNERARLHDELSKAATAEFPGEVDQPALLAMAAGREGNPVVGRILGREIRADSVRRGMAEVNHPSNDIKSEEKVALTVLEAQMTKFRFAALAERDGFGRRPDFVSDLADRRLRLLADAYTEQQIYPGVKPTAAEIEAFYTANAGRLRRGEEREIFEILVPEQAQAEAIAARLAAGGDFAGELREHSTGATREQGGRLGFLQAGDVLPVLDAAIARLQTGGISAPVKSPFGWHLLRCGQITTGRVPPLDEVRSALEIQVRDEQRAKAVTAAVARLAPDVPVEFNQKRFQEVLEGL